MPGRAGFGLDGGDGGQQFGHRQRLQSGDVLGAQGFQRGGGDRRRAFRGAVADGGATLDDGAVKQALRHRHGEQGADLGAAAGFAENGDAGRIAAEGRDIGLHPLQGGHQIQQPGIAGLGEIRPANGGQVQEAENIQSMVDVDHHDIALSQPRWAYVVGIAGAGGKGTAMQPHHYRPLAVLAWRGDGDRQAVLALRRGIAFAEKIRHFQPVRISAAHLRRLAGNGGGIAHPVPIRHRLRRAETVSPGGGGAIGDAEPRWHTIQQGTAHPAIGDGHNQVGLVSHTRFPCPRWPQHAAGWPQPTRAAMARSVSSAAQSIAPSNRPRSRPWRSTI